MTKPSLPALVFGVLGVFAFLSLTGCNAGHSAQTQPVRNALDQGDTPRALQILDRLLRVRDADTLPRSMASQNAVLVLDRASVQQSLGRIAASKRDYEAADKAIDVLDLSHDAVDVAGRWLYSDSAHRYVAPPHEKLLVNVLNELNYLETNDLSGARIEARRMSVMARFLRSQDLDPSPSLAFGSLLAGFTYEKSGNPEEARRYYDDARVPHDQPLFEPGEQEDGELLVVVGWGRVPHLVAKRVPVGASFTTWMNYPALAPDLPLGPPPTIRIDDQLVSLDAILDVASEVRADWTKIEGAVHASAATRALTRKAIGAAIEGASQTSEKDEVRAAGVLLSLFAQIALTAADVPDTRSWETLPARLGLVRVRLPAGAHRVAIAGRGQSREGSLQIERAGWRVTTMLSLR